MSSIKVIIKGNSKGKDKTVNSAPFELVFEISAEIIVVVAAMPMLPKRKNIKNINKSVITINLMNNAKQSVIIILLIIKSEKLNNNLPEKITVEVAFNCRINIVPRSSSDINILDNPDIAEKNMTNQYNPHAIAFDISILTEIATIVIVIKMKSI